MLQLDLTLVGKGGAFMVIGYKVELQLVQLLLGLKQEKQWVIFSRGKNSFLFFNCLEYLLHVCIFFNFVDMTANMYSESREEARDYARLRNVYFEQVCDYVLFFAFLLPNLVFLYSLGCFFLSLIGSRL